MELPVLDKFCFIFDLRSGCFVLGVLNTVLSLALAILLINFAADLREPSDTAAAYLKKPDERDEIGMSSIVYTIVILLVILLFIKTVADLVFVYGVYKQKTIILKKYCIFWMVFLVLFIIGFLKTLFHMDAGYVIAQILFLAENFYFVVIIRSYLISINEDGVL